MQPSPVLLELLARERERESIAAGDPARRHLWRQGPRPRGWRRLLSLLSQAMERLGRGL